MCYSFIFIIFLSIFCVFVYSFLLLRVHATVFKEWLLTLCPGNALSSGFKGPCGYPGFELVLLCTIHVPYLLFYFLFNLLCQCIFHNKKEILEKWKFIIINILLFLSFMTLHSVITPNRVWNWIHRHIENKYT